jgi:hypothetical protein
VKPPTSWISWISPGVGRALLAVASSIATVSALAIAREFPGSESRWADSIRVGFVAVAILHLIALAGALRAKTWGWIGLNVLGSSWFVFGLSLLLGVPQDIDPNFNAVPYLLPEIVAAILLLVTDVVLLADAADRFTA